MQSLFRAARLCALLSMPSWSQGGKELLDWLKQYSPTGYFVINDYETRAGKAGDYKKWLLTTTSPVGVGAVHESNHARNGLNSNATHKASYLILGNQDFAFAKSFTPYKSTEMTPDIPDSLVNVQTDNYISGKSGPGSNMYSIVGGIFGIMEEWDAYVTGLKSAAEMAPCFQANFNTAKAWGDLAGEATTSVWSATEFRYFTLRYVLRAKQSHPDVYNQILASSELRQFYTYLCQFADTAANEWIAVLKAKNMDTQTKNGFDWYWKFYYEIRKPELADMDKLLLAPSVSLAPRARKGTLQVSSAPPRGLFGACDLQGRWMPPGRISAPSGVILLPGRN
jgi:hypothetical protein